MQNSIFFAVSSGNRGVGKTTLAAQVEEAKKAPLRFNGDTDGKARDDSGRFAKAEVEQRSSGRQGSSREYLLRRIARDHPEMLDDIGPGKKYRSARAAAIAAGVIQDVPTVRLTDPDKVVDQVLERMGPEWAAQLAAALTERLTSAD